LSLTVDAREEIASANDFERLACEQAGGMLRALDLQSLVVSVTLRCNQACSHCHVSSSPSRDETMAPEVMERVVEIASNLRPTVVDITGGAPELNPHLPDFIRALRDAGLRVQVRTNLTVLAAEQHRDMAAFYTHAGVELLASMPCYTERNVSALRGPGVHDVSVRMLRRLNDAGYGVEGGQRLDLIYNPVGTTLPEPQAQLEDLFREEMTRRFAVSFTRLLTMTNMPVGRFKEQLISQGGHGRYVRALREAFNPDVLPFLQCRHQVEVGWDGRLYDCDFNLGDGRPVADGSPGSVWDFDSEAVAHRRIACRPHCFGCAAGAGSS
jgi:radical SAM/Cys-rich protein